MKQKSLRFITFISCLLILCLLCRGGLIEVDRVKAYHDRNYQWPPLDEEYIPNTEGWKKFMKRRLEQVQRIEDLGDMYNG